MKQVKLTALILCFTTLLAFAGPKAGKQVHRITGTAAMQGMGTYLGQAPTTVKNTASLLSGLGQSSTIDLKYAPKHACPIFLRSPKVYSTNGVTSNATWELIAKEFLTANQRLLNIINPASEFRMETSTTDELGMTHIKLQQQYKGVDVYCSEVMLHLSSTGTTLTGRFVPTPILPNPSHAVSDNTAVQIAIINLSKELIISELNTDVKKLLKYNGPTSEMVLYPKDEFNPTDRWAYHVTIRPNLIERWELFVDEETGEVFHKLNTTCTTGATTTTLSDLNGQSQTLNTYQHSNGNYYMIDITRSMYNAGQSSMPDNPVGAIWTLDAQGSSASNIQVAQISTSNNSSWGSNSATASSAHNNGAKAYEYYKNTHNRNSIDGNGGTVIGVIHVTDQNGNAMDNAFWNGQLMAYGDGNVAFKSLAGGLDVAGHEMTHGVVQSSANLKYQSQSGALNESMADVFGTMIDRSNWTIGEQVVNTSYFPSGALRDLSDPHNGTTQGNNGWQPARMSEIVNTSNDNGGVHINSGIPNKAFYLFASNSSVGKSKAEAVYYRALTKYLTASSQFLDARIAVIQSAADLYGASGAEVQAARSAFDQVEIYDGTNTVPVDTSHVVGTEWIICQNTDPTNDPNALYLIDPSNGSTYHALNKVFALNNVSANDNGDSAFYVPSDHNVYRITTNYSNPQTLALTTSGDWDNVAVSRDGKRIALVSKYIDTAIYIYDRVSNQSQKFHLYSPTFSQGQTGSNGPVYADAIDWDPTGEYIIFDEKNIINNTGSTTDIEYWDIGIMHVWKNSSNTFADGQIAKLVNNLADGVSIGNPVFSKNHPEIIAFDEINSSTGTTVYNVVGANINTGSSATIVSDTKIPGAPSFSAIDDRIVYSTRDANDTFTLNIANLGSDRISGSGTPAILTSSATWGVWLTQGTRVGTQCSGVSINVSAHGVTYPLSGSVTLDAGIGYSNYQWSNGATTQTISVSTPGVYNVTGTKNGCTVTSANFAVGYPSGISDVNEDSYRIYPIPTTELLHVQLGVGSTVRECTLTDLSGRVVTSQAIERTETSISMCNFASGVYLLQLHGALGEIVGVRRIVKK